MAVPPGRSESADGCTHVVESISGRRKSMRASPRTVGLIKWSAAGLCILSVLKGPLAAQTARDTIIRGGTVVNADGRAVADVKIRDGVIAEIGPDLAAS